MITHLCGWEDRGKPCGKPGAPVGLRPTATFYTWSGALCERHSASLCALLVKHGFRPEGKRLAAYLGKSGVPFNAEQVRAECQLEPNSGRVSNQMIEDYARTH